MVDTLNSTENAIANHCSNYVLSPMLIMNLLIPLIDYRIEIYGDRYNNLNKLK